MSTHETTSSMHVRATIPGTHYHRVRRLVQTICVILFILLPLTDAMRFDIPHQRFYFFGAELYISEFAILFFTMMFLWILVAAMAMIYGRLYCGYLCPQMIFSEASMVSERWVARRVRKLFPHASDQTKTMTARALFYVLGIPPSIFFAFIFVSFFVPPVDLFHRLMHLDLRSPGGIVGASVTLVTFVDFAILRTHFCINICPYGYLQNMLADKHTLLVHFHDPNKQCIRCEKCVRACPVGIDVRRSSHQLECTHCAECIDACSGILGKLNRKTLIQYGWGDTSNDLQQNRAWYRRIGMRDGKRVAILVLLLVYATGLSIAIGMRQPVLVQIMPDRATLYTVAPDGKVHNSFRILAFNRGRVDAHVALAVSDLASASITDLDQGVTLKPGEQMQREFTIAASTSALKPGINPMLILAVVVPAQKAQRFDENFFAPFDAGPPATTIPHSSAAKP